MCTKLRHWSHPIFIAGAGKEPEPLPNISNFDFSLYRPKDRGRSRTQNRRRLIFLCQNHNYDAAPALAPVLAPAPNPIFGSYSEKIQN
jgi:hypothetical protein